MGVRPAAAFGSKVNGFDERELKQLRSSLLQGLSPNRGSLIKRLVLFGDPAWREALAPALEYAVQVWEATINPRADWGLQNIAAMWIAARPATATTWATTRGPLQRAVLSMRRASWEPLSAFVWRDAAGLEYDLRKPASPNSTPPAQRVGGAARRGSLAARGTWRRVPPAARALF